MPSMLNLKSCNLKSTKKVAAENKKSLPCITQSRHIKTKRKTNFLFLQNS